MKPVELTTCKPIKSKKTRKAMMDLAGSLLKEHHIEDTCSQWLEFDGWRTLKTDPVSDHARGKGFGELGMSDRLYIRYLHRESKFAQSTFIGKAHAELMWIEYKRKDGTARQHQKDWRARETVRGALVLLAGADFPKTIEGLQYWYRNSGLMRRKI